MIKIVISAFLLLMTKFAVDFYGKLNFIVNNTLTSNQLNDNSIDTIASKLVVTDISWLYYITYTIIVSMFVVPMIKQIKKDDL